MILSRLTSLVLLTALFPAPSPAYGAATDARLYRCAGTAGNAGVQAVACDSDSVHQQLRPLTPGDAPAAPREGQRREISLRGRAPGPCQIVVPRLPEVISVPVGAGRQDGGQAAAVGWVDVPLAGSDHPLPPCPVSSRP